MREIFVRGSARPALVDDCDYERLVQRNWTLTVNGYVRTWTYAGYKKGKLLLMHELILERPDGMCVDHADHDKLNNQRSNLRLVTYSENLQNSHKRQLHQGKPTTSKYKGVHRLKANGRYYAYIKVGSKQKSLGGFGSEVEAAHAYDQAALEKFGEFACTNF